MRILFITPNLDIGGTNSSLASLISNSYFSDEVKVFPISGDGNFISSFRKILIPYNKWLHSYYCNFGRISGYKRINVALAKILFKFLSWLKIDVQSLLIESTIKELKLKYNFELVVAFQEGLPTKFVSLFEGVKRVAWVHCDYSRIHNPLNSQLLVYDKFDTIVCVSEYTASQFKTIFPTLERKVTYIYNFFDKDWVLSQSEVNLHDNIIKEESRFSIVSLGRIDPVKMYSTIPLIAAKLKNKGLSFCWYIIGPPCHYGEYSQIVEQIREYDLDNEVVMMGGKPNPYPYLKFADLFVSLSLSEACPMVFNEAKLLGLPIVSTDFGSAHEFVESGVNGIICQREIIADKIERLILDKDFYASLKKGVLEDTWDNEIIKRRINEILN